MNNKLFIRNNSYAITKIDGVWRVIQGEKIGCDFYYILNGKMDVIFDGNFYSFNDNSISLREIEEEAIRLNINEMRRRRR